MKDPIVQVGSPVLRKKAKSVAKKDIGSRALNTVIARMKKALAREEHGVAIAAPQIGASLRLFVVAGKVFRRRDDEEAEETAVPQDRVFINPILMRLSKKKQEMSEGCLSVRGTYGSVLRHQKASVKALDETGKESTYHASGLLAHIFQHECDHLDGILYTDKALRVEADEGVAPLRRRKAPAR